MQSTGLIQGLSLPARMEAILYLKGRPLSLAELAEIGQFFHLSSIVAHHFIAKTRFSSLGAE